MITWITIFTAGFLTYATRLFPIITFGKFDIPVQVERALRFVPVSVLTAIFLPELVYINEDLRLSLLNPRLLAGLLTIIVAWKTKNVIYTIVIGMVTLWTLQYLYNLPMIEIGY